MATSRIYPTPNRLKLVAEAEEHGDGMLHSDRADELVRAGWLGLDSAGYHVTAYGRAIRDIRVLDFGDQLIAETGDADEPRVLGQSVRNQRGGLWLTTVRGRPDTAAKTKVRAREEMRHAAAEVLAAETPEVTG